MTDTTPSDPDADAQPSNGDDESVIPTADGAGTESGGSDGWSDPGPTRPDADRIVYYAQLAAFLILAVLALVATFRFYFAASDAIRTWVSRDFVSAFQAAFNLLILILSVLGLSVLVRRMRAE